MTTYFKLYLLTRLDSINALLITLGILLTLSVLIIIIFSLTSLDFDEFYTGKKLEARIKLRTKFNNNLRWIIPLTLFIVVLSISMPTKKDVIFIVAGGETIDFIQSDTSIAKIPEQTTMLISEILEKKIEDINNKTTKN